jgi:hypothetical protein
MGAMPHVAETVLRYTAPATTPAAIADAVL